LGTSVQSSGFRIRNEEPQSSQRGIAATKEDTITTDYTDCPGRKVVTAILAALSIDTEQLMKMAA